MFLNQGVHIQKVCLSSNFVSHRTSTQPDCFAAHAPRKDSTSSLGAMRSNLMGNAEGYTMPIQSADQDASIVLQKMKVVSRL